MRRFLIFTIICSLLAAFSLDGLARRTRQQVGRDRRNTEQRIKQTRQQIQQNKEETRRALNRYNSVQAQISLHSDTITALRHRIDSVTGAVNRLNDSINILSNRITSLRSNYAQTLRNMRARRQTMSDWAFIFSANSFGQAWRRYRYLQQIAESTTRRARQLRTEAQRLEQARSQLQTLQAALQSDINAQQRVQSSLRAEQAQADALVRDLRRNQRSLNDELKRRQQQIANLDDELNRIIAEEAAEAAARERAERERREREERERREREERERQQRQQQQQQQQRQNQQQTPAPQPQPQPAQPQQPSSQPASRPVATSGNFATAKGKLMAPVTGRYSIVAHYGRSSHAELSKVQVNNTGIDIEATPGANARAVFDGEVTRIFVVEGYHNVVLVRHGEYITVYCGLANVAVSKGAKVKAGQALGAIFVDQADSNRAILHFEVRHERSTLNPEEWLK